MNALELPNQAQMLDASTLRMERELPGPIERGWQ